MLIKVIYGVPYYGDQLPRYFEVEELVRSNRVHVISLTETEIQFLYITSSPMSGHTATLVTLRSPDDPPQTERISLADDGIYSIGDASSIVQSPDPDESRVPRTLEEARVWVSERYMQGFSGHPAHIGLIDCSTSLDVTIVIGKTYLPTSVLDAIIYYFGFRVFEPFMTNENHVCLARFEQFGSID